MIRKVKPDSQDPAVEIIRQRRTDLGLFPMHVLVKASIGEGVKDVSPTTWTKLLLHGKWPEYPHIRAAMCAALRWTPNSFDRIQAGLEPIPIGTEENITPSALAWIQERITSLDVRVYALEHPEVTETPEDPIRMEALSKSRQVTRRK